MIGASEFHTISGLWRPKEAYCRSRRSLTRRAVALSQIGPEPLEDLPPLQIEQAEADRSRRPVGCGCVEDRAGGVCGLNFGFSENGRAMIGGDAKELEAEALRSDGEHAFELVQWVNLEKSDGRAGVATPPQATLASNSVRVGSSSPRGSRACRAMRLATCAQWAAPSEAPACRCRRRASE